MITYAKPDVCVAYLKTLTKVYKIYNKQLDRCEGCKQCQNINLTTVLKEHQQVEAKKSQ